MMREDWVETTINELISNTGIFCDGDWIESKDQDPSGDVRLIQLADIKDGYFINKSSRYLTSTKSNELKCTHLNQGDILVARMPDPLGRATIFPLAGNTNFVTVVDVAIIRTGHSYINNKYLLYNINSPQRRQDIAALQSGSTRKRISRKNLSKILFPLAPLSEQRAIVAKIEELFSRLDRGISDLEKAAAQLKIYRQAVLKKAFSGELSKEWRSKQTNLPTASELLKQIKTERQSHHQLQLADWQKNVQRWEDGGKEGKKPVKPRALKKVIPFDMSELKNFKKLPSHWSWTKLGIIFDIFIGSTPSRKENKYWDNGNINWVSSGEVAFNLINKTKEKITKLGLKNTSTTIHPIGTVMLAMIGEGKTRGQAAILNTVACHNQNTAAIRVSERGFYPAFLFHYLFLKYQKNRKVGSGNNQKALNQGRIKNFEYPLCSLEVNQVAGDHKIENNMKFKAISSIMQCN